MKKILLLLSFVFIFSSSAWCQTFSYGVKAGYITYGQFNVDSDIEGTHIHGSQGPNGYTDGWRLAALTRAEYKRWFAQAELAYAGGVRNNVTVNNWNNPGNIQEMDNWLFSKGILLNQTELSLSGGYRLKKWLFLSTGLGLWHIVPKGGKESAYYDEIYAEDGTTDYVAKAYNKKNRIFDGVQDSYQPLVLTHQLGIGIEIKRNFSLDITYHHSLTPVSKTLEYKEQHYTFRQSTDRFVVSLGYRFYKLKNNNKLFKKRN